MGYRRGCGLIGPKRTGGLAVGQRGDRDRGEHPAVPSPISTVPGESIERPPSRCRCGIDVMRSLVMRESDHDLVSTRRSKLLYNWTMANKLRPGQLNATTDRHASTIRWVKTQYRRVERLAEELGLSKNDAFNLLIREALDARALRQQEIDITLDECGRARVEARERVRAGV